LPPGGSHWRSQGRGRSDSPRSGRCSSRLPDDARPQLPASSYFSANPRAARSCAVVTPSGALRSRAGGRDPAGVTGRDFPHRWRHAYATCLTRGAVRRQQTAVPLAICTPRRPLFYGPTQARSRPPPVQPPLLNVNSVLSVSPLWMGVVRCWSWATRSRERLDVPFAR
jgi:hypothetical protein